MSKKVLLGSCPNCDAQWGIEEMSFQECDSCGYPDDMDDDDGVERDEFPDDDDDFLDEYQEEPPL
jgi:Zn ribbon nucleic-acid-binding protein